MYALRPDTVNHTELQFYPSRYVARSDSPGSFQRWEDMTDIDPDNQVKTPSPRGGAATWYKNDDEPVLYLFGGFGPETSRGTPMGYVGAHNIPGIHPLYTLWGT